MTKRKNLSGIRNGRSQDTPPSAHPGGNPPSGDSQAGSGGSSGQSSSGGGISGWAIFGIIAGVFTFGLGGTHHLHLLTEANVLQ